MQDYRSKREYMQDPVKFYGILMSGQNKVSSWEFVNDDTVMLTYKKHDKNLSSKTRPQTLFLLPSPPAGNACICTVSWTKLCVSSRVLYYGTEIRGREKIINYIYFE